MHPNQPKATLTTEVIQDIADSRIHRIVARTQDGQQTTAGILFTGDVFAHEQAAQTLDLLSDAYGLPSGHWHREAAGDMPVFCTAPDTDADAWLSFAKDYGVPPELAPSVLTAERGSGAA